MRQVYMLHDVPCQRVLQTGNVLHVGAAGAFIERVSGVFKPSCAFLPEKFCQRTVFNRVIHENVSGFFGKYALQLFNGQGFPAFRQPSRPLKPNCFFGGSGVRNLMIFRRFPEISVDGCVRLLKETPCRQKQIPVEVLDYC